MCAGRQVSAEVALARARKREEALVRDVARLAAEGDAARSAGTSLEATVHAMAVDPAAGDRIVILETELAEVTPPPFPPPPLTPRGGRPHHSLRQSSMLLLLLFFARQLYPTH